MSKMRLQKPLPRRTADPVSSSLEADFWWSQPGSNRRPQACKASALPTELWPRTRRKFRKFRLPKKRKTLRPRIEQTLVGRVGVEPTTSRLSGVRSNHLSYRPPPSRANGALRRASPVTAQRRLVRHSSGAATADFQDEGT